MKVDVFLPIAPKDLFRLRILVKYLNLNVPNIGNIHICTPSKIEKIKGFSNIKYHTDLEILPYVKPKNWKFRPNWIFQQFLKLFQNVTETEYFLTVDADTIIVKPLELFEGETPIWHYGKDQNEAQYHTFNNVMFGLDRLANHTYIGDIGLFKKSIIDDMLTTFNTTKEDIIKKSYEVINVSCHISEFELYGNFLEYKYHKLYKSKQLKTIYSGKFQHNPYECNWTRDELLDIINKGKEEGCDVVNMHSWCIASHNWNEESVKFE